ncbi:prolipoprotein diacylglyceryl transferase [Mycolicibacterium fortuitum]|uniref:prolipoprotein diacylglyceryl transferase n=1 Tax=Mycolicibacterium fortuitum TaxID=1766 RepID=UPI0007EC4259|nr:prolipoprotein diacylglyceryl transferase [Mycolicibacterium fortuitum]OBJ96140.1 prolipoprotein diacylglyceryl transferase [Mycolicibacterium fortuitum]
MTTTVLAYLPSPSQGVWHLGPVPIRAYALCIIIGIIAALVIGDRRWQARGGQAGVIYDIALWAVPFGLVGGRLYHVMTDWPTYFGPTGKGLGAAFQVWQGGLGIWGAVALGGVGAWIGCRSRGIPLPAFGDAIAPGIILAQAIGRLGNYFNQELFGRDTTLPWGLEIYKRLNAAGQVDDLNGVSTGEVLRVVHPTFLYELLWNLLVFALLIWADRKFKLGHGRLFALYVAAYCVGRFCVELMRSDHASMPFADIRVNTFTSAFVFIGAFVYIILATRGREDPATLAGKRDDEEDESALDELGKELVAVGATTGVVAAATVAGEEDDDDDDADHMHPDEVGASEDDGAEAAAAIELKAIPAEPDTESEEVEGEAEAEPDETAEDEAVEEPESDEAEVECVDDSGAGEDAESVDEAGTDVEDEEGREGEAGEAEVVEEPESDEAEDGVTDEADDESAEAGSVDDSGAGGDVESVDEAGTVDDEEAQEGEAGEAEVVEEPEPGEAEDGVTDEGVDESAEAESVDDTDGGEDAEAVDEPEPGEAEDDVTDEADAEVAAEAEPESAIEATDAEDEAEGEQAESDVPEEVAAGDDAAEPSESPDSDEDEPEAAETSAADETTQAATAVDDNPSEAEAEAEAEAEGDDVAAENSDEPDEADTDDVVDAPGDAAPEPAAVPEPAKRAGRMRRLFRRNR